MENFDEQIKYVFKKAYTVDYGTIPEGTEIILMRGWVYINGGMADDYSRGLIMNIINNPKKRDEYLVRMKIIGNKI
jgi:hypothetical protein